MFDPLVLPISTGIEEDRRNALETIEGTRLISKELPKCHTVVGLSNVSFGLKPAARVVLNSAFLHELREAGLTGAIVHARRSCRRTASRQEQWDAALDLIYDRRARALIRSRTSSGCSPTTPAGPLRAAKGAYENLPIEEKLKRHIIDGEKRNLIEHLDEALKTYRRWRSSTTSCSKG
jgi:5-methyltetrahydrofolate--homocysteine methyltransferase